MFGSRDKDAEEENSKEDKIVNDAVPFTLEDFVSIKQNRSKIDTGLYLQIINPMRFIILDDKLEGTLTIYGQNKIVMDFFANSDKFDNYFRKFVKRE